MTPVKKKRASYERTPEHRERMRLATKGIPKSEATKQKLRKPKSEAAKEALRKAAQSPDVTKKRQATMFQKYGVAHAKQIPEKNENRVEYWQLRGLTEQEAKELISSRQKEWASRVVNRVSHWATTYWEDRGYSPDEAKARVSELQRANGAKSDITVSYVGTHFLDGLQELLGVSIEREVSVGPFVVDGIIESRKIVVEFFGDFWHMHSSLFEADDIHPVTGWKASSKWREDAGRVKYMESMGYAVFVVWETEAKTQNYEFVQSLVERITRAYS